MVTESKRVRTVSRRVKNDSQARRSGKRSCQLSWWIEDRWSSRSLKSQLEAVACCQPLVRTEKKRS